MFPSRLSLVLSLMISVGTIMWFILHKNISVISYLLNSIRHSPVFSHQVSNTTSHHPQATAAARNNIKTAFCISGNVRNGHYPRDAETLRMSIDHLDANGLVFAYVNPCDATTKPWNWGTTVRDEKYGIVLRPLNKGERKNMTFVPLKCPADPWINSSFLTTVNPTRYKTYTDADVKSPPGLKCKLYAGVYPMFKGIRECFRMIEQYEQEHNMLFETIVRMRPDTCGKVYDCTKLYSNCSLSKLNKSKIYARIHGAEMLGTRRLVVYDNFAIVPRQYASIYFKTVESDQFDQCRGVAYGEYVLSRHLERFLPRTAFRNLCECQIHRNCWLKGAPVLD